jgi:hypothetical protein
MDAALKEKWVAALRSSKYKQGRSRLRTKDDKFCCLGVLCDVIDSEKWELSEGGDCYIYTADRHQSATFIPNTITDVSGSDQSLLIGMNDTNEMSFNRIADYIERKL